MDHEKKECPLAAEALRASYGTAALLPIEFFKDRAADLRNLITTTLARTFLSSGTTQADRSQSCFSKAGLDSYQKNSLRAFEEVLRRFFPNPLAVPGLSLIPPVSAWPDSSLAQMVAWIGEEFSLEYWDGSTPRSETPVWVFGTAFHFVNLADDGVRLRLPEGSVVIETGGTKGRSRSVTREELYTLIEEHLAVPRNRIVSEYGMCELATQAYDAVENPEGPELGLQERWFRFPDDIAVSIYDRLSGAQSCGEGTLVVHDAWRLDYPWPIRTEDMVRLRADGAFQLLGRVPRSPLKGCSLLAEEIAGPGPVPLFSSSGQHFQGPVSEARAAQVHAIAQELLHDEAFWNLWRKELQNTRAAEWLREDLARSLPSSIAAWQAAATVAVGTGCPQRWLVIPPDSHNFAWLYPMMMGAVLGLPMSLRIAKDNALALDLQKRLAPLGGFRRWDAPQRIGIDPLPEVDAVLIFGSDETIAAVQALCPLPVQGFGSSLAVSLMYEKGDPDELVKDAFSLLQRGCMASRVLFVLQDTAVETAQTNFLQSLRHIKQALGPLPLGWDLALEHAAFGLRCQGLSPWPRPSQGAPLFLVQAFDPEKNLQSVLLDCPLSLSLVLVPKNLWADFAEWLPAQKNLHKIAIHNRESLPLPLDDQRFECVDAGQANAPKWDGRHQKRPLFTPG